MIQDYWKYDGLALAELVRSGAKTPLELAQSAIAAVERLNPALNAVCHDLSQHAAAQCEQLQPHRPFAGAPFRARASLARPPTSHSRFQSERGRCIRARGR